MPGSKADFLPMESTGRVVSELRMYGFALAGLSGAFLVDGRFAHAPEWLGQAVLLGFLAIPICSMILRNGDNWLRFRVATGILLATAGMAVVAWEPVRVPAGLAAGLLGGLTLLYASLTAKRATIRK